MVGVSGSRDGHPGRLSIAGAQRRAKWVCSRPVALRYEARKISLGRITGGGMFFCADVYKNP